MEAAKMRVQSQYDFLKTVNGYNRAITDYVLSVRQDISQPTRLASVLIGRNAVENRVAKKSQASKSVIDRSMARTSQNPKILPASTSQKLLTRNQRENGISSGAGQSQKIDFGPTAESQKAANYDPRKVVAEAPVSQTKPASATQPYSGNGQRQDRTGSSAASNIRLPQNRSTSFGGSPLQNTNNATARPTAKPIVPGKQGSELMGQLQNRSADSANGSQKSIALPSGSGGIQGNGKAGAAPQGPL